MKLELEQNVVMDTVEEYTKALIAACRKGSVEIVKLLLEKGADVNGGDENNHAPLIIACWNGSLDVIKLLLEYGANVNHIAAWWGQTALQAAASNGSVDIVQLLLEYGADINYINTNYDQTLLDRSV